jgi:hypothetical protein
MEYGDFLRGLDPVILGIDSGNFSLDRDAYWSMTSKEARRVLSSKYTLTRVSKDYFDVEASFSVAIQLPNEDGPIVQALKIECVFEGHFHAVAPVDSEHAKRFAETESWLLFWPFFRQFVSDTTARMSIPPIMVPLALGPGERSYKLARRKEIDGKQDKAKAPTRRHKKTPK